MSTPATLPEIAAAVREVLAEAPRGVEELTQAVQVLGVDLGDHPAGAIDEVFYFDGLGPVLAGLDGRWMWLPALLMGRTFTHCLSEDEVAGDCVDLSPDLEAVPMLTDDPTYRALTDGSPIVSVLPTMDESPLADRGIPTADLGDEVWLLLPGTWRDLGATAGDLVGLTVREDGFELSVVDAALGDAADLGGRLGGILEKYAEGPAELNGVLWQLCLDAPESFLTAQPPVRAAIEAAELAWEREWIAPPEFDFTSWRAHQRIEHITSTYRLEESDALTVFLLSIMFDDFEETLDPSDVVVNPVLQGSLRLLDFTPVIDAVLGETIGSGRDGADALALFAETLEPQAPRAARPNLRWLRGKARERAGDVLAAEQDYEAALQLDGACLAALLDLARIASDRGDAERGLSLLRRAEVDEDDGLVEVLQHFRPVERSDLGRNDRCWCGSGRKYKVCHLNRETHPLEDRAAWLYQKAGMYAGDGPWYDELLDLADVRAADWTDEDALLQALEDLVVVDSLLFEGGAFQAFLEERGVLLPDDERLLAEQWLRVERSVHEIESVAPGEGFTARDVRTGHQQVVREGTASRTLRPGDLICARLVPAGDTVQCIGGIEPVAPHQRDHLVALLDSEPEADDLVAFLSRR